MKKLLLALVLSVLAVPVTPVAAHVLETNNGVGAVLHIDPQDDPVAGEPSTFYFSFSQTNKSFSIANCDCTLDITQNGKSLGQSALTIQGVADGRVSYTLPNRGAYQLILRGKPINGANFNTFALTYTVRVSQGVGGAAVDYQSRAIYLLALGAGGIVLFLLLRSTIVYNVKYYAEKPRKSRNAHQRKSR